MALLDRLKDATKPINSIEAVQTQPQPAPELGRQEPRITTPAAPATRTAEAAAPAPVATAPTPARDASKQDKAPAYASEPEAISKAYYVEQRGSERRYFDDYQRKALAIRADDTAISSKREDLNTIRAMLTMAEARGWSEVKVNGTADFRREAWIEAATRGIAAQGHKASDLDRQEADRRRAERGPDATRTTPPEGNEVRRAAPQPVPEAARQEPRVAAPAPSATPQQAGIGTAEVLPSRPAPEPGVSRPVKLEVVAGQEKAGPGTEKPAQQTPADYRKTVREAESVLSDNGKLMLAALSDNIDRKMNKLNAEAKAEMKAFTATELVKKERTEGPIMLTKEQIELARGPQPIRGQDGAADRVNTQDNAPKRAPAAAAEAAAPERAPEAPKQAPRVVRQGPELEPERPRRSRSR